MEVTCPRCGFVTGLYDPEYDLPDHEVSGICGGLECGWALTATVEDHVVVDVEVER